jgi:hypothetical protein
LNLHITGIYVQEFARNVAYDIEENNSSIYNGDATARVINSKGEEQTIIVKTGDYSSDKSKNGRKKELLQKLKSEKKYNEEFIEGINYDLN